MKALLLLLLPAVALGNVVIKPSAGQKCTSANVTTCGPVNDLVCTGAATCSRSGSTATLLVTAVGPDGGSLSGTGACSANNWVNAVNATAAPTCAQPAFSNISSTATDAQLASAYSGVGACAANTWVSTATRNAAPTCTQPSSSNLSDGSNLGLRPAWATILHATTGDGDPLRALDMWAVGNGIQAPSPDNITTSLARCVKYRSRYDIEVNRIRLYAMANTTSLYAFAVYSGAGTKVIDTGAVTTVANTWLAITVAAVKLTADADYWFCVSAVAAGVTPAFFSPYPPLYADFWKASAAPLGGRSIQLPEYVQVSTDGGGGFWDPMPTKAAAAFAGGATGAVPFALFDTGTSDGT